MHQNSGAHARGRAAEQKGRGLLLVLILPEEGRLTVGAQTRDQALTVGGRHGGERILHQSARLPSIKLGLESVDVVQSATAGAGGADDASFGIEHLGFLLSLS